MRFQSQLACAWTCLLALSVHAEEPPAFTYSEHIAPILNRHCVSCHRPGQVGPMPLTNYQETRPWVKSIKAEVAARTMPPWHADKGDFAFANDRSLTREEIEAIIAWADSGAPQGDPALMPSLPKFNDSWKIGEPDIVLEMEKPWRVEPGSDDTYRSYVLDHEFKENTWLRAVEIMPGNPRVVHHINVWSAPYAAARARDERDPENGWSVFMGIDVEGGPLSYLGGFAPGVEPPVATPGTAWLIPKGNAVVIEVHYSPGEQPEADQTRVGLYKAAGPVKQEIRMTAVTTEKIHIPAGADHHLISTTTLFPFDAHIHSVIAHMHLLGKAMRIEMMYPDGKKATLLNVPRFDFNWQNFYVFEKPVPVPAGTLILGMGIYDNSAQNPDNPNRPPKDVFFGPSTTDEMLGGHFFYTKDDQDLTQSQGGTSARR